MGILDFLRGGSVKKESGDEQWERVTGAKKPGDLAWEKATGAKPITKNEIKPVSRMDRINNVISDQKERIGRASKAFDESSAFMMGGNTGGRRKGRNEIDLMDYLNGNMNGPRRKRKK